MKLTVHVVVVDIPKSRFNAVVVVVAVVAVIVVVVVVVVVVVGVESFQPTGITIPDPQCCRFDLSRVQPQKARHVVDSAGFGAVSFDRISSTSVDTGCLCFSPRCFADLVCLTSTLP